MEYGLLHDEDVNERPLSGSILPRDLLYAVLFKSRGGHVIQ